MGLFKPNFEKMKAKKDIRGLTKALDDKDTLIRRKAAKTLGEIADEATVEPLVRALKGAEDHDVRFLAAEALGRIGGTRIVELLIEALQDRNWGVRSQAAEGLGKIKDAGAVDPLCESLRREDNDGVRDSIVWALGEIKDVRAIGTLIWEMSRPSGWYSLGGPQQALALIGEPAVEPLIESLREYDDSAFRSRVTSILASIGEPATEALNEALKDKYEHVREGALRALEKMKANKR